ncbi:hypothetical protein BEWA_018950 [Theileria equi strain WA]|uniref:tRNA(Phe) 7-[(3-amino-3-carboxypropyl)-4-demethylwyosine(37)-N(4)]-methyltransferase n=1 Tax=Theileria equi strain WA TaxID=1537102 RepID=L0AU27_THEEQ|nr:hypothetical protein BEWA_018950 [Theileria equi strain WA]AFZ79050.1 hypothetical protein BEWA_018950 [Theileria equi strain WA]|eukprot:XP_004828716.1 hypothetical protein BEWA_018950 [Theileria equi strain WA]
MKFSAESVHKLLGSELFEGIYDGTREYVFPNLNPSSNKGALDANNQQFVTSIYRNLRRIIITLNPAKNIADVNNKANNDSTGTTLELLLDQPLVTFINKEDCKKIGVLDKYDWDSNINVDKSLKGSVDVLLQPLLRLLLKTGDYVTTSCCSGRISIFENSENDLLIHSRGQNIYGRSGRILFSSHCHVIDSHIDNINHILTSHVSEKHMCYRNEGVENDNIRSDASSFDAEWDTSSSDVEYNAEKQVIIKFEPFIIHVECKDIPSALRLLRICKFSGLKQSGIVSYSNRLILAIRGISVLESPILHRCYREIRDESGNVKSQIFESSNWLVAPSYFRYLISTCNQKLTQNMRQIVRFYWICRNEFSELYDFVPVDTTSDSTSEIILPINNEAKYVIRCNTFGENVGKMLSLQRYKCCVASNGRFVCLFGGYSRGNSNDIALFDLKNVNGGFKIMHTINGPDCFKDASIISDKKANFIIVGGRTSVMSISSDVWVLQISDNMQTNWVKCKCENTRSLPKPRFRHAICLKESDCSSTVFYMSGGVSTVKPIDEGLISDIWEGTIDFTHKNGVLTDAVIKWVCLSDAQSGSVGWCSGTIFHSVSLNSIVFVGGYLSHRSTFSTTPKHIEELYVFNLSSLEFSNINVRSANEFISKNNSKSDDLHIYPLQRMAHSMVQISNDEFIVLGGIVSGHFINDIWYLNAKYWFWYCIGALPSVRTHARCGLAFVNFKLDGCEHRELWTLGGGSMIAVFGTHFDPPSRLIVSCTKKCKRSVLLKTNTQLSVLCVTAKNAIKKVKQFLEDNKIYDKHRKIVYIDRNQYIRIYLYNEFRVITPSDVLEYNICALVPIYTTNLDLINGIDEELKRHLFFDAGDCVFQANLMDFERLELQKEKSDVCSQLKILVTKTLNGCVKNLEFPKKYDKIGDALIFSKKEMVTIASVMDHSSWSFIAKELGVTSIGIIDEIVGEKRIPELQLLFGDGNVKQKENGVYYLFNIEKNMFSSGNGTERIRIPKMYFGYLNTSQQESIKKPEIVVDLFCGIGYFVLPLLKYTDSSRVKQVFACDINHDAIDNLNSGVKYNGIQEDRVVTHVGNSEFFGIDFGFEFVNKAHRVFLGLIPYSECAWESSLRAIDKEYGGMIHVHGVSELIVLQSISYFKLIKSTEKWPILDEGNTSVCKPSRSEAWKTQFPQHVLKSFHELCKSSPIMEGRSWTLEILHVEVVKKYSPYKYHIVVDLNITPCQ